LKKPSTAVPHVKRSIYTLEQAAVELNMKVYSVRTLIHKNKLKYIGDRPMYVSQKAIDEFIEKEQRYYSESQEETP
jgi:hypothetical protein